jgi:hypothetical protein
MLISSKGPDTTPSSGNRVLSLAAIVAAVLGVYACNDATSPGTARSPQSLKPGAKPSVSVTPGVTTLCKYGPGATFQVRVGVNATSQTVTVNGGQCVDVATVNPAARDDVIISVAENLASHYALDHIVMQHGTDAAKTITGTNSVSFEGAHGAVVTFYNNALVNVCKVGTNATFQYQVGLGDSFHPLSLNDGQCSTVATIPPPAGADDVIVTVRENTSPSYKLDHISLAYGGLTPQTITGTSTVSFEGVHGAQVTFHNTPVSTPQGCTYTQGYYKNKGSDLLPTGNFYLSGQSWLSVLDTAPKGGNPYYVLAHQFIAASINAKSASTTVAVNAALTGAAAYFAKATPDNWSVSGTYSKDQLTGWADVLDAYNNGATGPGHCD